MDTRRLRTFGRWLVLAACGSSVAVVTRALLHDRAGPPTSVRDGALAYQALVLENGLSVVLVPRRDANEVRVTVWYRVGSADERPGQWGIAHVAEHALVQGSASGIHDALDERLSELAFDANAATSYDTTRFFAEAPPASLDDLLSLEAARMSVRAAEMTNEALESARRSVIVEVKTQDGRATSIRGPQEELWRLFTGHPYGHAPSGDVDDLARITPANIRDWIQRHFQPGRAVLAVSGAFDAAATERHIRRVFGALRSAASVPLTLEGCGPPPAVDGTQAHAAGAAGEAATLMWSIPGGGAAAAHVLDISRSLLEARVRAELETTTGLHGGELETEVRTRRLCGTYTLSLAGGRPGSVDRLAAAARQAFKALAEQGPTDAEVRQAQETAVRTTSIRAESAHDYADFIGQLAAVSGAPFAARDRLLKAATITSGEIQRVVADTLDGGVAPVRSERQLREVSAPSTHVAAHIGIQVARADGPPVVVRIPAPEGSIAMEMAWRIPAELAGLESCVLDVLKQASTRVAAEAGRHRTSRLWRWSYDAVNGAVGVGVRFDAEDADEAIARLQALTTHGAGAVECRSPAVSATPRSNRELARRELLTHLEGVPADGERTATVSGVSSATGDTHPAMAIRPTLIVVAPDGDVARRNVETWIERLSRAAVPEISVRGVPRRVPRASPASRSAWSVSCSQIGRVGLTSVSVAMVGMVGADDCPSRLGADLAARILRRRLQRELRSATSLSYDVFVEAVEPSHRRSAFYAYADGERESTPRLARAIRDVLAAGSGEPFTVGEVRRAIREQRLQRQRAVASPDRLLVNVMEEVGGRPPLLSCPASTASDAQIAALAWRTVRATVGTACVVVAGTHNP